MGARLQGRVTLVTGAGRGIGAAIAQRLASEMGTVFVADIAKERAGVVANSINESGRGVAHAVEHDVTSRASWDAVIDQIKTVAGRLDILVNNAGITIAKDVESTTLEEWRRMMTLNLEGPFIGVQAALPELRKAALNTPFGGSIVNMSSVSGIIGTPTLAAYTASKAGLRYFSKSIALDFARKGYRIRVNSVHPGSMETESSQIVFQAQVDAGKSASFQAARSAWIANYPIGRIGNPSEAADGVLFLASDESSYITGTELIIDGGLSAQ
jgi:3(or 17)beta-hydroxysteroid dehydrogenase